MQARARPAAEQPLALLPTNPTAAAQLTSKQRRNKAKKQKKRQQANLNADGDDAFDDEDDPDDLPPLEDSAAMPISATLAQTQSDLLATANDLYRQIESAAAAALAGHLPNAPNNVNGPTSLPNLPVRAAGGDENDDAYWLSLPAHLRSFIRSALPLAAGLPPPQGQGIPPSAQAQAALSLTPEQMHQAAQQLAQVVQSAGWAGLAGDAGLAGQRTAANGNGATTTIPLGSFTLPLPLHSHPNAAEPDYIEQDGQGFDEEYSGDDASEHIEATSAKRKKKKKKAKGASQTDSMAPPPSAPLPQPTARPQQQPITRSAVPAKPGLVNPGGAPNGISGKGSHSTVNPSAPSAVASNKLAPIAGGSNPSAAQRASNLEREKIRDFWLALSERERRDLVKVEKEAVLRKMKEQQRHGCTCAVCGRKRNAIEEELEVLYDAYYDELEQYALQQRRYQSSGGAIPHPPGPGPFPGSVDLSQVQAAVDRNALPTAPLKVPPKPTRDHKNPRPAGNVGATHTHTASCPHHHHHHPPANVATNDRGKAAVPVAADDAYDSEGSEEYDEDEDEEEYDEDEEYDEEEDELPPEVEQKKAPLPSRVAPAQTQVAKRPAPQGSDGFLGFGGSLTVKAPGILTVADDLLKNDGQKFLEMMESLADKRIQREREVQEMYVEEDEEEEGSYDGESDEEGSEEDDEDDEEEDEDEEILTEEQRMEEGRRMFQIFAARMFEQRVLQAYREKIAKERQEQLLRELEDEDRALADREAKKAKDAQKKKDKKKAQREKLEADRLKEQQLKDETEAAAKAAADAKAEEERKRTEAQRVQREEQREEQRRQKEAEAMRREEEKRKRLEEEARKRREKEEKVKAEREARLAREREERDRKAREDAERKAKADAERKERDTAAKAAREEAAKRSAAEKISASSAKLNTEVQIKSRSAQTRPAQTSPDHKGTTTPRSPSVVRAIAPSAISPPGLQPTLGNATPVPMQKPVALPPGIVRPQSSGKPILGGPMPMQSNMPISGMMPGMPLPTSGMGPQPQQQQPQQQQQRGGPPHMPPAPMTGRGMPNIPGGQMPGVQYGNSGRMGPSPLPMMGQNGPPMRGVPPQMPASMSSPSYGAVGVGPGPSQAHKSPLYAQPQPPGSVPPSQSSSAAPSAATSPAAQRTSLSSRANFGGITSSMPADGLPSAGVNGVSPIGAPVKTPSGVTSPTSASSLAALNAGSISVPRKASVEHGAIGPPPGHLRRTSQADKSVMPIGRGRPLNGDLEDSSAPSSSSASLREASPPPVMGSSALNEDLDELEPSTSASSSAYNDSAYSAATWGSGIWGGMPNVNGWNAPAPEPISSPVDRASVIRDRTRLACQSLTHALGRPVHSFSDVFKVMVDNFPDTASVELNEILNSCAQPGNAFNGGGRFHFDQSGDNILLRFD